MFYSQLVIVRNVPTLLLFLDCKQQNYKPAVGTICNLM